MHNVTNKKKTKIIGSRTLQTVTMDKSYRKIKRVFQGLYWEKSVSFVKHLDCNFSSLHDQKKQDVQSNARRMCHYQSERNNTHLNLAIQGQIFQQGLYTSTKTPRRISQGREHQPSDDTQATINREARRWNRCRAVASWRFWALFALMRCVTWGNCVSKCGVETRPPHADGTQQLPRNFLDQDSQGGFYCTGGGGGVGEQLQCQQLRHALDPSGGGEEGKNTHNTATVNRCSLPLSTCWQHVDLPAIKVAHNKGPWVQNRTIPCITPFQSISIKLQKPKQNIQIINISSCSIGDFYCTYVKKRNGGISMQDMNHITGTRCCEDDHESRPWL